MKLLEVLNNLLLLLLFACSFYEIRLLQILVPPRTVSNVTLVKKARAGTTTFRYPLKSKLERRKAISIAEWNVRTSTLQL